MAGSGAGPCCVIRYGTVWEDADLLCRALAPVAPGNRLLSIASAGDNVLALLTLDPAEVVAVDHNPAQLACLELRIAAFRLLGPTEAGRFLGAQPCAERRRLYGGLRAALSPAAREFWDRRPAAVTRGILHAGRLERYLALFRNVALPLVHSRRTVRRLLTAAEPEERARFHDQVWDTPRWRGLFRCFFSGTVMARLGRQASHFRYGEGRIAESILQRTRRALVEQDPTLNPYLSLILTGGYSETALPLYLRPEHHATIQTRLDRIRILRGDITAAPGPFHGFNLSDLFEYLSLEEHNRTYHALIRQAAPGARLLYWNLLAPRSRPPDLEGSVVPLPEAAGLQVLDRVWFYSRLHLEEVRPE